MTPEQWQATPWDLQQAYLDGLSEDPGVPFRIHREQVPDGPRARKAAAGAAVIDISAMIRDLDANPEARRRQ